MLSSKWKLVNNLEQMASPQVSICTFGMLSEKTSQQQLGSLRITHGELRVSIQPMRP